MAVAKVASEADRAEVARIFLEGLGSGAPLDDIRRALRPWADYAFPFSGDVLTEIGAQALAVAGVAPETPLSLTDATERYLVEWPASGNTARQKHRAAMQAVIAEHAGIVVDYDEIAGWWQVQDHASHAFDAAVVIVRAASDHCDRSMESLCAQIAERRSQAGGLGR
jgi:hypothetical protein